MCWTLILSAACPISSMHAVRTSEALFVVGYRGLMHEAIYWSQRRLTATLLTPSNMWTRSVSPGNMTWLKAHDTSILGCTS